MGAVKDVSIGTSASGGVAGTTQALTTTATVSAGSTILVMAACWQTTNPTTLSLTGGGLTWTQDVTAVNGNERVSIFRAYAPTGLASGTVLTLTCTNTTGDRFLGGVSFRNVWAAASPVNTTASAGSTGTGWNAGTLATDQETFQFVAAFCDGLTGSSTPGGTDAEEFDTNNATDTETWVCQYSNSPNASSTSHTGTWSGTPTNAWVAASAAYKITPRPLTIITPRGTYF